MPLNERIMALDVGEARIGVAFSDPEGIIATPHSVIIVNDNTVVLNDIVDLITKQEVKRIVVGMPRSLSGDMGQQAQVTEQFIERLSRCCNIPIDTWDERFSTTSANRSMKQSNLKKQEQKHWRDAIAAAFILQSYLERRRFALLNDTEEKDHLS